MCRLPLCVWLFACFDREIFHQWSNLRMVGKLHKEASHSAARVSCVWSFLLWEKLSSLNLNASLPQDWRLGRLPVALEFEPEQQLHRTRGAKQTGLSCKLQLAILLCSDLPDKVFLLYAVSKSEVSHQLINVASIHSFIHSFFNWHHKFASLNGIWTNESSALKVKATNKVTNMHLVEVLSPKWF